MTGNNIQINKKPLKPLESLAIGIPTGFIGFTTFLPFSFYGMFPFFKPYVENYNQNKFVIAFGAAFLAALPTAMITHPLDRIRVMQHQLADEKKHDLMHCMKALYNNRATFFKGLVPRTAGSVSTVLAMGTTVEFLQSFRS